MPDFTSPDGNGISVPVATPDYEAGQVLKDNFTAISTALDTKMVKASNLSDLANKDTSVANLFAGITGWVTASYSAIANGTTVQQFINRVGLLYNTIFGASTAGYVWTNDGTNGGWAVLGSSGSATINAQTGTTYTVQASDAGKMVTLSNAAAITVTCSGLSSGSYCYFRQKGAGQVTFATGTLTVRHVASLTKTAGQYAQVFAFVDGTDIIFSGEMSS